MIYEINLEAKEISIICSREIVRIFNNAYYIVHYFLPPFHKCPLHFLKKALKGDKKVKVSIITKIDAEAEGCHYNWSSEVRWTFCS